MAGPGQSIGRFRIGTKLGAGGMGEVWRATDTQLNREVAIKVLPTALASDPIRMARFRREAEVLASLNHPNIATIYGVEAGALVMELVEGPTLAERIAQGKLPLDEALPIAAQMADALEYAHSRGIIHRDLKPANVKITPEGRVKVLDFGLAKAISNESSAEAADAVTLTTPATLVGTILGTAAYMAPEQARGKPLDRRADIWAFGVVLYEMLTGHRPFIGEDMTDTLAAVVRSEPELSELPDPARGVIARCLQKDPRQRWGCAADAAYALQQPPAAAAAAAAAPRRLRLLPLAIAVAAVIAAVLLTWWLKPQLPPAGAVRFSYLLPAGQSFWRSGRHVLAISPDGANIVYTEDAHLYLRPLDALDAHVIQGTAPDLYEPVFSPDGQWIAYINPVPHDVLQKIPVSGGAPVTICSLGAPISDLGVSWSGDRIVFGHVDKNGSAIEAVSADGGTPQVLATVAHGDVATEPQLVDGGRRLLFTVVPRGVSGDDTDQIVIQDPGSRATRHVLLTGGANPHLLPGNLMVYIHDGTLYGVRIDPSHGAVTGSPVPLVEGVVESHSIAAGQYAVAGNGTLVYWPGSFAGTLLYPTWVDPNGQKTATGMPGRDYHSPRISPDGKRIAVDIRNAQSQHWNIWIWNTVRSTMTRLTFGPADRAQVQPEWSPDGRYIYYTSFDPTVRARPSNLYRIAADGSGAAKLVATTPGLLDSISPDGKLGVIEAGSPSHFVLLPLQVGGKPSTLLSEAPLADEDAAISPDGHWIAYDSSAADSEQIFVRPFPNVNAGRWQISTGIAVYPMWSRDGKTLYYLALHGGTSDIAGVSVQTAGGAFSAGAPHVFLPSASGRVFPFDVGPNGRLLITEPPSLAVSGSKAESLTVVTNWTQAAEARVH